MPYNKNFLVNFWTATILLSRFFDYRRHFIRQCRFQCFRVFLVFFLLFGENGDGGIGNAFFDVFARRVERVNVAFVIKIRILIKFAQEFEKYFAIAIAGIAIMMPSRPNNLPPTSKPRKTAIGCRFKSAAHNSRR